MLATLVLSVLLTPAAAQESCRRDAGLEAMSFAFEYARQGVPGFAQKATLTFAGCGLTGGSDMEAADEERTYASADGRYAVQLLSSGPGVHVRLAQKKFGYWKNMAHLGLYDPAELSTSILDWTGTIDDADYAEVRKSAGRITYLNVARVTLAPAARR